MALRQHMGIAPHRGKAWQALKLPTERLATVAANRNIQPKEARGLGSVQDMALAKWSPDGNPLVPADVPPAVGEGEFP
jgi:hypothetical protein